MEARLNRLDAWLADDKPVTEPVREDFSRLDEYYRSSLWRGDFEADERGELPPDLKRGVLSQDGLNDLLEEKHDRD